MRLIILFCLMGMGPASATSLVSADWLETAPHVTVLQIDTGPLDDQGPFIKGAVYSSFYRDGWVVDYPPLLNMLPPPEIMSQTVSKLGLAEDEPIVIASVQPTLENLSAAARVFWTLKSYGYSHLFLLDGGVPLYVEQGFALSKSPKTPVDQEIKLTRANPKWLATYAEVYAGADYGTPVIDARDYDRAGGETRRHDLALRQGKIFDAVIVPADVQLDARTKTFKSREEILTLYEDVWGEPPGPIIFYSDTGLRAALSWFSAHEIAGQKDVRLYDGSYLEWDHLGHEVYDETDDMGGPIGG